MDLILYTMGGFDVFWTLFNAIASLLGGKDSGMLMPIVKMSLGIGVFSSVIYMGMSANARPMLNWAVSYVVILNGLLLPVSTVHIRDTMTNQVGTIDNVPFALAIVSTTLSRISYAITRSVEQALQPSPTYGSANRDPNPAEFSRLCYTKTGYVFGAHAMAQMKGVQITNHDVADNMREFVCQCVVYDALVTPKYTLHDLKNSSNIWGLVSEKPSKIRGFSWRDIERSPNGTFLRSNGTEIITCAQGVQRFNDLWREMTSSALQKIGIDILQYFGSKTAHDAVLGNQVKGYLPGALDRLTGIAQSAEGRIQQQLMIDAVVDGVERKAVELGSAPNFEVRRAYFQQRETYKTIGQTMAQTLPFMKNVIEAFLYGLFILVVFGAMLPSGWRVLSFWVKGCLWVNVWPTLFAIVNFLATEAMSSQVAGKLGTASGITIANSVAIANATADMAAYAGYMASMIPLLSWWVVEQSGYALTNMAGSLLQVSQNTATSAAHDVTTGNMSYGNVGVGASQFYNASQLKQDLAPSYQSGHFTANDGISSKITSADGEQLLNVQTSNLPVSIHSSSHQEAIKRQAYNDSMSLHESESNQASQHLSAASRDFLEFGKNASQMVSSGHQWSNSTTAGIMEETGSVYNKMRDISSNFKIGEELTNQLAAQASAGIGKSGLMGILSASLATEKREASTSSLSKATDEIIKLGTSEDYKKAVNHLNQAHQNSDFHTNDQQLSHLAQSFSSNTEKSQQHSQNASKALERSKGLSSELAHIQSNAHRIDAAETQGFVNWASQKLGGHHRVEDLAKHNVGALQNMAQDYLTSKYGSPSSFSVTRSSLADAYKGSSYGASGGANGNYDRQVMERAQSNNLSLSVPVSEEPRIQAVQMIDVAQSRTFQNKRPILVEVNTAESSFEDKAQGHIKDNMGYLQEGSGTEKYERFKNDNKI